VQPDRQEVAGRVAERQVPGSQTCRSNSGI
jgi:hypothetical protein